MLSRYCPEANFVPKDSILSAEFNDRKFNRKRIKMYIGLRMLAKRI